MNVSKLQVDVNVQAFIKEARMIDLHLHSHFSDGQHSPADLVDIAACQGVHTLALTDHDSVSGVGMAQDAAEAKGLDCLAAIELSTWAGQDIHILGYYIDINNEKLVALCEDTTQQLIERESRIYEYLSKHQIILAEQDVRCYVHPMGRVMRPHFAQAMVAAGYVETVRQAFDDYLDTPEYQFIERTKPGVEDGINLIRGAGGVAVLAHPGKLGLPEDTLRDLISHWVEMGLQGLECFHSQHSPQETSLFLNLAKQFGLTATGGSDFHGQQVRAGIQVGVGAGLTPLVQNENCLKQLLELHLMNG